MYCYTTGFSPVDSSPCVSSAPPQSSCSHFYILDKWLCLSPQSGSANAPPDFLQEHQKEEEPIVTSDVIGHTAGLCYELLTKPLARKSWSLVCKLLLLTWRVGRRLLLGWGDQGFLLLAALGCWSLTHTGCSWAWNILIIYESFYLWSFPCFFSVLLMFVTLHLRNLFFSRCWDWTKKTKPHACLWMVGEHVNSEENSTVLTRGFLAAHLQYTITKT